MIYHYTSIESLACILESRCLRFTRLDYVDDPKEYSFIRNGINPAKYVFVSCWTASSEETIPQWKLYGDNGRGVRIGIIDDVFSIIQSPDNKNPSLFPIDYFNDKDYVIMPIVNTIAQPLYPIVYLDDLSSVTERIFSNDQLDFKETARYKGAEWSFQKECRFIIYAFPKKIGTDKTDYLNNIVLNKQIPNRRYIDIPIDDNAYNSISVTIGPDANSADELILKSLLKKYLENETFAKSSFKNLIIGD